MREYNPVTGVLRKDLAVNPYERARKLSVEEFQKILAVIDTNTVRGAQDRTVFLFYVLCTRRNEVVHLSCQDLRVGNGKVVYQVRLKGGKTKWKELPPPVWEALKHYLKLAGRKLNGEGPVFTPTVDNGKYLRRYYSKDDASGETPLTGAAVEQALKRYAKRAGLDESRISLHGLRHLGAKLFSQVSGDVRQTRQFLDHAYLNTIQIYLEQLSGETHRHWQEMMNRSGISEN